LLLTPFFAGQAPAFGFGETAELTAAH
jgi:hypothetical protein